MIGIERAAAPSRWSLPSCAGGRGAMRTQPSADVGTGSGDVGSTVIPELQPYVKEPSMPGAEYTVDARLGEPEGAEVGSFEGTYGVAWRLEAELKR